MSEVKFDPMMISAGPEGVNHLERLQASCDGLDAQNDSLAIENSSLREQLDAQRLRADTAEAELKREKEFHAANVSESERMLAAAEQRITDLYSTCAIDAAAKKLAECMDYPWEHMPEKGRASMRDHAKSIIDAALNPNAEAESHEKH